LAVINNLRLIEDATFWLTPYTVLQDIIYMYKEIARFQIFSL